jgi:hypothetical protein
MAVAALVGSPPNAPRLINLSWAFAGMAGSMIATSRTIKLRLYPVVFMVQFSFVIK